MKYLKMKYLTFAIVISLFHQTVSQYVRKKEFQNFSLNSKNSSEASGPLIRLTDKPYRPTYNISGNASSISLTCESKYPNRWIWKADITETEGKSVEVKKTRTKNDMFISELIIDIQGGGDFSNFSCVREKNITLLSLVPCVSIEDKVSDNSDFLEFYTINILKDNTFQDCTKIDVENLTHSKLHVDLERRKLACVGGKEKPVFQSCRNLDHCESLVLTYDINHENRGVIANLSNSVGLMWKPSNFPQIAYCFQKSEKYHVLYTSFLVLYPAYNGTVWKNFSYFPTLENALQIKNHAIQVRAFSMSHKETVKSDVVQKNYEFAENETIQIRCRSVRFLHMKGMRITLNKYNSNVKIENIFNQEEEKEVNNFNLKTDRLVVNSKVYGEKFAIACKSPIWNSLEWSSSEIDVSIYPAETPFVSLTKWKDPKGDLIVLNCTYGGWPRPNVTWSSSVPVKFINETSHIPESSQYQTNNTWFQIRSFRGLSKLSVTCKATNFQGEDKQSIQIESSWLTPLNISIIVTSAAISVAAITGILIFYWRYRKRLSLYKKAKQLTVEEIEEFYAGAAHSSIEYEALQMPYNREFEIEKGSLHLDGTVLGSGQFGLVLKGQLGQMIVAVKAVKPTADVIYVKSLLSELKILQFVGQHPNIVNLIGAVTTNIKKREVLLVLDYCSNGNLVTLLRQCRERFVDFFNQTSKSNKQQYPLYENSRDVTLTTWNLILFACEIASAMDHLALKNVIHGDLAARNILVTEDLHAKVCDFGLAKQLLHYSVYVQKIDCPLPLRWMAIESLQDMEFSLASDRWSYGICLWEIFSLAELPYPGEQFSFASYKALQDGHRMEKPNFANESIYKLMLDCWSGNPQDRPPYDYILRQLKEEEELLS